MALVPSAVFNLIEGDINYRKIVAQISSVPPLVGVSYNVYFRVDGPVAPLRLPNFTLPDGTLTPSVSVESMPLVNLPLDSNGNTLEGTYVLKYFIEDTTVPGVYSEITSTINLNVLKEGNLSSCKIVPNLSIDVDCFCYQLTATDNTVYSLAGYNVTLNSRILTVVIPTIPGQPTPTPVSTTDATITLGFDYSNVTYIINLEAEYEHENADGTIVVIENIIATYSQKIDCDFNLCKLVECLAKTMAALESKAAKVGGWPNLPIYERDTIYQIQQLITLLELYRNCGNYTKVYDIYKKLIDLIGCDCGCGDGKGDQPIAVSPSCGGSGAVSNIVGIYPIIVNQAGLTATISIDPTYLEAALLTYIGENGITISTGPGPTRTVELGGLLTQNTTITGGSNNLVINDLSNLLLSGGGVVIETNTNTGIGINSNAGGVVVEGLDDVTIQSTGGDVNVGTTTGDVNVNSTNDVYINSTAGKIDVSTPNEITISSVNGKIDINTKNAITIESTSTDVNLISPATINLQSTDEIVISAVNKITHQATNGQLDYTNLEFNISGIIDLKGNSGVNITTPNVITSTAQEDDVLTLINATTGECDFKRANNVVYFNDNPTSINYTDDGLGARNVLSFDIQADEIKNNGDFIEIDALMTVQGTTGTNPIFNITYFPVFQHTANETYKQTLKGKIIRTSSTSFYCTFTSEIYDLSTGEFITSYHQNSTGVFNWALVSTLSLIFDLGVGDHQSTWKHFIVTKFKI